MQHNPDTCPTWIAPLQDCGTGEYSTAGASACQTCGTGTYSPARSRSCIKCQKGTYQDATKSAGCKTCTAGSYCPKDGMRWGTLQCLLLRLLLCKLLSSPGWHYQPGTLRST